MVIRSLRKFYIPILLLSEERFEKKLEFYLDFEKSSFLTNRRFSTGPYGGVRQDFFPNFFFKVQRVWISYYMFSRVNVTYIWKKK